MEATKSAKKLDVMIGDLAEYFKMVLGSANSISLRDGITLDPPMDVNSAVSLFDKLMEIDDMERASSIAVRPCDLPWFCARASNRSRAVSWILVLDLEMDRFNETGYTGGLLCFSEGFDRTNVTMTLSHCYKLACDLLDAARTIPPIPIGFRDDPCTSSKPEDGKPHDTSPIL